MDLIHHTAAVLKSADPRELTQRVASHLYALTDERDSNAVDGVRFASNTATT